MNEKTVKFNTGGKFATGTISTPAVPVANLSPVSSIPVVHLDLRKIRNDPKFIFRGLVKMIHEKNIKQKIS